MGLDFCILVVYRVSKFYIAPSKQYWNKNLLKENVKVTWEMNSNSSDEIGALIGLSKALECIAELVNNDLIRWLEGRLVAESQNLMTVRCLMVSMWGKLREKCISSIKNFDWPSQEHRERGVCFRKKQSVGRKRSLGFVGLRFLSNLDLWDFNEWLLKSRWNILHSLPLETC